LSDKFKTIELYPLADLHIGDPKTDTVLFHKFVVHILDKPNRFIVVNGDISNNAIKSSISNVYNESMPPREQKKWLKYELECIKDRILAMTDGNHEYRTSKDSDQHIIEDIADHLGIGHVYRQDEAVIKITFGRQKENSKRAVYTIYMTHGTGGGKRPGSAINNLELLGLSIDTDIYIVGHTHKKFAYKNSFRKIDIRNNVIRTVERLFVSSSAWQDFGGYATRKMLIPSAKGALPIILHGTEKKAEAII